MIKAPAETRLEVPHPEEVCRMLNGVFLLLYFFQISTMWTQSCLFRVSRFIFGAPWDPLMCSSVLMTAAQRKTPAIQWPVVSIPAAISWPPGRMTPSFCLPHPSPRCFPKVSLVLKDPVSRLLMQKGFIKKAVPIPNTYGQTFLSIEKMYKMSSLFLLWHCWIYFASGFKQFLPLISLSTPPLSLQTMWAIVMESVVPNHRPSWHNTHHRLL